MTITEKARRFAEYQLEIANDTGNTDDLVGFEYNGVFIYNPFTDETGRSDFSDIESILHYGVDNFVEFCKEAEKAFDEMESKKEKKERCCFCGKEIIGWGNNPDPASKEGRCCDECNIRIVIPTRIMMWSKEA